MGKAVQWLRVLKFAIAIDSTFILNHWFLLSVVGEEEVEEDNSFVNHMCCELRDFNIGNDSTCYTERSRAYSQHF